MKLTVGKKIVFGFGLGVIALVIVSLWAYLAISSIYDDVTRMSQIRDVRRTLIDAEKKHLHCMPPFSFYIFSFSFLRHSWVVNSEINFIFQSVFLMWRWGIISSRSLSLFILIPTGQPMDFKLTSKLGKKNALSLEN